MARLTRNSYKRKIILFGVFVFMSIALISTGFAAWVMSSDAEDTTQGNVSVGIVNDASLKINVTNKADLEAFTFLFEPAAGDNTGRVRLDSTDPKTEQLTFTIEGNITNAEILATDGFTIEMLLPEGMQKAIELNYIVAPECVGEAKVIDLDGEGNFSYTLTFKWGTAFEGINPSLYFDNDEDGLAVSDAEVKTILEDLRACVFNYYDELNTPGANRAEVIEAHEADELPKFEVKLIAKAN